MPTFPKAKYLFSAGELAFWTEKEKAGPAAFPWITDSVPPIVAANRAERVNSDHQLNELVRLLPTPGHTLDHFLGARRQARGQGRTGRAHRRRPAALAPAGALP